MIVNPKLTEYLSSISEAERKSTYLSFLSLSWTIGLAGGGLIGGYLYHHFGDKANLAQKYLNEVLNIKHNNPSTAFEILTQKTGLSNSGLTNLLADKYNPETFWIIFILIGVIASVGMLIYNKKANLQSKN
jgi:MFS family permease